MKKYKFIYILRNCKNFDRISILLQSHKKLDITEKDLDNFINKLKGDMTIDFIEIPFENIKKYTFRINKLRYRGFPDEWSKSFFMKISLIKYLLE